MAATVEMAEVGGNLCTTPEARPRVRTDSCFRTDSWAPSQEMIYMRTNSHGRKRFRGAGAMDDEGARSCVREVMKGERAEGSFSQNQGN